MTIESIQVGLLVLCNAGVLMRIVLCIITIITSGQDDAGNVVQMKKRIRNMIIFLIIANSLVGFKELIMRYFMG
ncbi:MAG: hypothetical protein Q4F88_05930 [Eubacteriales bacterium]|nr:hypothetical protein [Eubacteriales bacterium]